MLPTINQDEPGDGNVELNAAAPAAAVISGGLEEAEVDSFKQPAKKLPVAAGFPSVTGSSCSQQVIAKDTEATAVAAAAAAAAAATLEVVAVDVAASEVPQSADNNAEEVGWGTDRQARSRSLLLSRSAHEVAGSAGRAPGGIKIAGAGTAAGTGSEEGASAGIEASAGTEPGVGASADR